MKFVSKSSNLLIVLRPGIPGNHLTGTQPQPMVSARFKDGMFDSTDKKIIDMMLLHPGFGADFISTDDTMGVDPYASARVSSEPEHVTMTLKNGQVIGGGNAPKAQLTPEMKRALEDYVNTEAKKRAEAMAPYIAAEFIKNKVAEQGNESVVTSDSASMSVEPVPAAKKAKKK